MKKLKTNMEKKRGQVTIFIILAVIIVAVGILIYLFYPQIRSTLDFSDESPEQYFRTCLEDDVLESIEQVSIHGGSIDPDFYYEYYGDKLEYLCYTNKEYTPCVMQRPMLKEHIESEIRNNILASADRCLDSLETNYQKKGYTVDLERGPLLLSLIPGKVVIESFSELTLTKVDAEQYDSMTITVDNNLYELTMIVLSILNFEARFGDSETTMYMDNYKDMKVEKKKQSDGTTVYVIKDRKSENKFQFASRSVAWPAGY